MGRILAIDYGQKRVGIAVTDEMQIIANGLKAVSTNEVITFLKNYTANEKVDTIVVGEPHRMDNSLSQVETEIRQFIDELKKIIPHIPIVRYDERFTSKIASQAMFTMGLKKKDRQKKENIDTISATIILQSYMESR